MRLLNVHTLRVEEFSGSTVPAYAILSHCWGDDEVSFEDINLSSTEWALKTGSKKITSACVQSIKDGWEYIWIDTCCIDKRSSAEFSEAINSMYSWYEASDVCYAYLEDVLGPLEMPSSLSPKHSRWFTRGWTLQELIAPPKVNLYGHDWTFLGTRKDLADHISTITGIPKKVLREPLELGFTSVAKRMSWAAGRQTTRVEDVAYSLLGLFEVNMPLLYGEGSKAFIRLQEEILKNSDDQSLFAWRSDNDAPWDDELFLDGGVLAGSPAAFANSGNIIPFPVNAKRQPYSLTNKGLRIELRFWLERDDSAQIYYLALLNCQYDNDFSGCIAMILKETSEPNVFSRHSGFGSGLRKVDIKEMEDGKLGTIYIRRIPQLAQSAPRYVTCLVQPSQSIVKEGYRIVETRPKNTVWNKDSQTIQIWNNQFHTSWAAFHFRNDENCSGFVVFFKILKEFTDKAGIKICDMAGEGMAQHWLVSELGAGFENPKASCRLVKRPGSKEENGSNGKNSPLIKARAWTTERLNQQVCKITRTQTPSPTICRPLIFLSFSRELSNEACLVSQDAWNSSYIREQH